MIHDVPIVRVYLVIVFNIADQLMITILYFN